MIFEVIGTPEPKEVAHISDKRVLYYLSNFSKKPRKDLTQIFPAASSEALDLLQRLLTFSPHYRMTVDEALKHAFFDKVRHFGDQSASPNTTDGQTGFFKKNPTSVAGYNLYNGTSGISGF